MVIGVPATRPSASQKRTATASIPDPATMSDVQKYAIRAGVRSPKIGSTQNGVQVPQPGIERSRMVRSSAVVGRRQSQWPAKQPGGVKGGTVTAFGVSSPVETWFSG